MTVPERATGGGQRPDWGALSFSTYVDTAPLGVEPSEHCRLVVSGIPGSHGLAAGPVFLHLHTDHDLWVDARQIAPERVESELQRLDDAIEAVKHEKARLQRLSEERVGKTEARIFESHVMLLDDPEIRRKTEEMVREDRRNAGYAFFTALQEVINAISSIETPEHLRDRVIDIEDIRDGVLAELSGEKGVDLGSLREDSVVVAHALTPSDTARMQPETVLGFVTDTGGSTSHAAILARSMNIPAVLGCKRVSRSVRPGDTILIDGFSGKVYIDPDDVLVDEFERWTERLQEHAERLVEEAARPAETLDGHQVKIELNIELLDEARRVAGFPSDGVGLFRTEFLFLSRESLPGEQEQFQAYRELAELFASKDVIIRTMDVGGDKLCQQLEVSEESNPFLGWRAIRISLAQPEVFRSQLRAILRASAHGSIGVMFPLVTSLEELSEALGHLDQVREELRGRGVAFDGDMPAGVMIETPAAVMIADALAERSDFFSIGTNDLVQYTLAVDRNNERVAPLFDVYHPAVLRLIRETIRAGHDAGIEVHVCGEMAHEPLAAAVLVGMGVDRLSMAPGGMPEIKQLIRQFSMDDLREIAREALEQTTGSNVRTVVRHAMAERGLLSADAAYSVG